VKVSELCQSCCFRSVVVSRPHRTDCEVMRVSLALMDRECSRTLHRRLLHQLVPLLSASCAGATRRSFLVGRNGAAVCVNCVNAVDSVSGYSGVAPTSSRLPSRETSRHCANPAPHRRANVISRGKTTPFGHPPRLEPFKKFARMLRGHLDRILSWTITASSTVPSQV
jgi:hypothetical protein